MNAHDKAPLSANAAEQTIEIETTRLKKAGGGSQKSSSEKVARPMLAHEAARAAPAIAGGDAPNIERLGGALNIKDTARSPIPRLVENPGEFPCILRLNGFG
jgi:hypothetical protein